MSYKIDQGICHGRGFAAGGDPSGFLQCLYDFLITPAVSGGAGWTLLKSSLGASSPYAIFSSAPITNYNTIAKIIKISYSSSEAGYVRMQHYLSYDPVTSGVSGLWCGRRLATYDDADFAYDFRGGEEVLNIGSRRGTAWDFDGICDWQSVTNLCEGTGVIGSLASAIGGTGSNLTLQLQTGEAANFTSGNYYYMLDFNNHAWCEYFKCNGVNIGSDTIICSQSSYNFPSGSIVGAYPHRFYAYGTSMSTYIYEFNQLTIYDAKIPYVSDTSASYSMHNQADYINGKAELCVNENALLNLDPDDKGYYAVQRPLIKETYRNNDSIGSSNMNRVYGYPKYLYTTAAVGIAQMLDGRLINGSGYIYLDNANNLGFGMNSSLVVLILDTES